MTSSSPSCLAAISSNFPLPGNGDSEKQKRKLKGKEKKSIFCIFTQTNMKKISLFCAVIEKTKVFFMTLNFFLMFCNFREFFRTSCFDCLGNQGVTTKKEGEVRYIKEGGNSFFISISSTPVNSEFFKKSNNFLVSKKKIVLLYRRCIYRERLRMGRQAEQKKVGL